MKATRIIARLDVKGENVIKGVHLEGLRIVGKPYELAKKYTAAGADEIYYIDSVASLYGRNNLLEIVKETAKGCRVPLTVEGGLRTIADIDAVLNSGADKIGINSAALKSPEFLRQAAQIFGSQCIVLSVAAKRNENGRWIAYSDNGRENSSRDVLEWVALCNEMNIGEILLTSIDAEGTQAGFDLELYKAVCSLASVPVVASGGAGTIEHVTACLKQTSVDAVALASVLHYDIFAIPSIKAALKEDGIDVRIPTTSNEVIGSHDTSCTASIIDLNLGNLYSLQSAFQAIGCPSELIATPEDILRADRLVLPGVGAFGHGMDNLRSLGLLEAVLQYARTGRPLLGICLGAQFLLDSSEEFGLSQGLGLLPGAVKRIQIPEAPRLKVPFIGWARIYPAGDAGVEDGAGFSDEGGPLRDISRGEWMYFIHSYEMIPEKIHDILAISYYGPHQVCAAVRRDNVFGLQFHPEKSSYAGLKILRNFIES
jgi:imidazole glycerol phosphate synthase glutamine amidotransferase subunit